MSESRMKMLMEIGAGIGAGAVMRHAPDVVMPTEDIAKGIANALESFKDNKWYPTEWQSDNINGFIVFDPYEKSERQFYATFYLNKYDEAYLNQYDGTTKEFATFEEAKNWLESKALGENND